MNLKSRFLILGLVFTAFILIAIGVLAFALGYTFDPDTKKIVATATLVVNSEPKNAEIFLNGRSTGKTTPATLRLLSPGEYDLALKKTGYSSYEKRLSLLPKQVVWLEPASGKVILFLSHPVPFQFSSSVTDIFYLDSKAWALSATSTLAIQELATGKARDFGLAPLGENQSLKFSSDSLWGAIHEDGEIIRVISLANETSVRLEDFGLEFRAFESLGREELLLASNSGELYQYDLKDRILKLRKRAIRGFAAENDTIYMVGAGSIFAANRASTTLELLASGLPEKFPAAIVPAERHGLFLLLDSTLYRLDPAPQILAREVKQVSWDKRSQTLVWRDSHSIWLFKPGTHITPELIVRTSGNLDMPVINSAANQVFYLEAGVVKAVEALSMGPRKIWEFPSRGGEIKKFLVDTQGKTLYVLLADGTVYLIEIR